MTAHPHAGQIPSWISTERFATFLKAAGGDVDTACRLYEWSASASGAAFEAIQYMEVVLRNAIDEAISSSKDEQRTRIPWFLLPICDDTATQKRIDDDVAVVRRRLRALSAQREARGQIIAGLSFGFWAHLLGTKHENLWRSAVRHAFPHSSGNRKDVAAALHQLNLFRNRLAHHDSLLSVDLTFRLSQISDVLGWINPDSAQWLAVNERVTAVIDARPAGRQDTVVVAANDAWPLYQDARAYVCQAGRAFRSVDYLGFYCAGAIQADIPSVQDRIDNVDWSPAGENHLRSTGDARDLRIADVIAKSRAAGWTAGRYQVFLLSAPGETGHWTLPKPVTNPRRGRGSAWTRYQRYAVRDQIARATTTDDV